MIQGKGTLIIWSTTAFQQLSGQNTHIHSFLRERIQQNCILLQHKHQFAKKYNYHQLRYKTYYNEEENSKAKCWFVHNSSS